MTSLIKDSLAELAEINSLENIIEIISQNLSLNDKTKNNLFAWSKIKHNLFEATDKKNANKKLSKSFEELFSMSDEEIVNIGISTRKGERTPSKKTRNIIIGWCAEEIVINYLNQVPDIVEIEMSGVDRSRILVKRFTPTDPDIILNLKNGKNLLVEVVSISKKTSDQKVRIKYNKLRQNEKRFFGITGKNEKYFLTPTLYLAVDLISKRGKPFIIGGENFYFNSKPYPFAGWENQMVIDFDIEKAATNSEVLKKINFIERQKRYCEMILSKHSHLNWIIKYYHSNDVLNMIKTDRNVKNLFKTIFEISSKMEELKNMIELNEADIKVLVKNLHSIKVEDKIQNKIIYDIDLQLTNIIGSK